MHSPENSTNKAHPQALGRKAASCFVPKRDPADAGEAVPWICCQYWQRRMPGCQGSLGLQAMSHENFKGSWTFFMETFLSHLKKIARLGSIRHILSFFPPLSALTFRGGFFKSQELITKNHQIPETCRADRSILVHTQSSGDLLGEQNSSALGSHG